MYGLCLLVTSLEGGQADDVHDFDTRDLCPMWWLRLGKE